MSEETTEDPSVGQTEELLATTVRLMASVEALAALIAHVRIRTEQIPVDPDTAELLAAIATVVRGTDQVTASEPAMQSVGMARSLMREALTLIDDPGRAGGWASTDPEVLQGIGRLSMAIAKVFVTIAPQLPGLGDALAAPGATFLDVGTGTGWLAIATAQAFPAVHVVGIDIYEPSLALARGNVERAGLGGRVEVRTQDATSLPEVDTYDAIWLPLPFLPKAIVPQAIAVACTALRPGGWLLPGTFAGPPIDELGVLLNDLRIRRSGGHPWDGAELGALLTDAGLVDVRALQRTWPAPVQLWAARRPG